MEHFLTALSLSVALLISPASDASVINQQTQEPVSLTETYWSVRDLNDKTIVCELFLFSSEDGKFISSAFQDQFIVRHYSISNEVPRIGFADPLNGETLNETRPYWSVENGKYDGYLFYLSASEIEIVNDDGIVKIRIWADSGFRYRECWDINGSSFQPTGYVGEPPPVYAPTENLIVSDYSETLPTDSPQNFINLASGQPVILDTVVWDVRRDLVGKVIGCLEYKWSEEYGGHYGLTRNLGRYVFFPPPGTSPNTIPVSTPTMNLSSRAGQVTLEILQGVQYGPRTFMAPVIERTRSSEGTSEIRIWESSEGFSQCRVLARFDSRLTYTDSDEDLAPISDADFLVSAQTNDTDSSPSTIVPVQVPSVCDYSNATLSNGWGWNETARESCAPLEESVDQEAVQLPVGCDYSNAPMFNGWGWNETSRESCAPLSETAEQAVAREPNGCDYSNAALANGWGWNETTRESCAPL